MSKIKNFSHTNILVCGDIMVDHYLYGETTRLSSEAPIPIYKINNEKFVPGGAANVANNILALNSKPILCGVIGDDAHGEFISDFFSNNGCNVDCIIIDGEKTTSKKRIIIDNQQVTRFDFDVLYENIPITSNAILSNIKKNISKIDVIAISDYLKGFINKPFIDKLINIVIIENPNVKIIIDSKPKNYIEMFKNTPCFIFTPNTKEAEQITGIEIIDDKTAKEACVYILNEYRCENVLLTMGHLGMMLVSKNTDDIYRINALSRNKSDVSGCGDTVVAALSVSLASGFTLREAVFFANKAASIAVSKHGTATASIKEISELLINNEN